MSLDAVPTRWLVVGLLGQAAFTARFLVQWFASERRKQSVVPVMFWWLSIAGGVLLLGYSLKQKDPVFILGQAAGILVYTRNLMLLRRTEARPTASSAVTPAERSIPSG
jgi:lipid-A-disaccharide synthase-like uncharacterized protein